MKLRRIKCCHFRPTLDTLQWRSEWCSLQWLQISRSTAWWTADTRLSACRRLRPRDVSLQLNFPALD